jgi:hypothetical protein
MIPQSHEDKTLVDESLSADDIQLIETYDLCGRLDDVLERSPIDLEPLLARVIAREDIDFESDDPWCDLGDGD